MRAVLQALNPKQHQCECDSDTLREEIEFKRKELTPGPCRTKDSTRFGGGIGGGGGGPHLQYGILTMGLMVMQLEPVVA